MPTHWKSQPEPHDYPAAGQYLTLLLTPAGARAVATSLNGQPISAWKAKDILRASGLPLLPRDNAHVQADLDKVKSGGKLSPVLLVRGELRSGRPLTIADGYHRVCASWYLDEDADIPCQMADLPAKA